MGYTVQFISKIPGGIRTAEEWPCESLEEAEQQAVAHTSGDTKDPVYDAPYDVAIIRRDDIVMARYFHTMQIA